MYAAGSKIHQIKILRRDWAIQFSDAASGGWVGYKLPGLLNVLISGFVTNTCLVWAGFTGLQHMFCATSKYALGFRLNLDEICSLEFRCQLTMMRFWGVFLFCIFGTFQKLVMMRAPEFVTSPPPLPRKPSTKRALYETCPRLEMA